MRALTREQRRSLFRLAQQGRTDPDVEVRAAAYEWSHDPRWNRLTNRLPGWLLPATGAVLAAAFIVASVALRAPSGPTVVLGLGCAAVVAMGLLGWLSTSNARAFRTLYPAAPTSAAPADERPRHGVDGLDGSVSITTARLVLRPIDDDEARRIHGRAKAPDDRWASDYPFEGDLAGIGAFLHATEQHGEQRPFGYYQVSLRSHGLAIGGIGFKGPPSEGAVEVGYGLVPSARGNGYATEALQAILDLSATLHVRTVRADTDLDNIASQRVLEKAGFARTGQDTGARYYEIDLRRNEPITER